MVDKIQKGWEKGEKKTHPFCREADAGNLFYI
jgi:hypothetical protein